MNTAAKGRRAEWLVRRYYEKEGYYVMRSAGSKGPADLVCMHPKGIIFIQVKSGIKPSGKSLVSAKRALEQLLYVTPTEKVWAILAWQMRGGKFHLWRTKMGGRLGWTEMERDLRE